MEKSSLFGVQEFEYRPFIREKTERLLIELLKLHKPKKILEIGTFLGYSAGVILENCDADVVTIEKDTQKVEFARKNLEKFGQRVRVLNMDALEFLEKNKCEFDFVFLDGAKGQYVKYLPYLESCLTKNGVLFVDDVLFYGLVNSAEKVSHKHRSIVNNLRLFLSKLENNPNFETQIFDFDDGVCVCEKK